MPNVVSACVALIALVILGAKVWAMEPSPRLIAVENDCCNIPPDIGVIAPIAYCGDIGTEPRGNCLRRAEGLNFFVIFVENFFSSIGWSCVVELRDDFKVAVMYEVRNIGGQWENIFRHYFKFVGKPTIEDRATAESYFVIEIRPNEKTSDHYSVVVSVGDAREVIGLIKVLHFAEQISGT